MGAGDHAWPASAPWPLRLGVFGSSPVQWGELDAQGQTQQVGAPTSPSVSLSRLGLPSGHNDTNNSDEKSIQNNSVLFWAAGLPRATEISKGESGFCEGALWGGIGEKMNLRSSQVSTENGSDSPAFSGPASQALAVYSLRRLTLKDLVPPPRKGLPKMSFQTAEQGEALL